MWCGNHFSGIIYSSKKVDKGSNFFNHCKRKKTFPTKFNKIFLAFAMLSCQHFFFYLCGHEMRFTIATWVAVLRGCAAEVLLVPAVGHAGTAGGRADWLPPQGGDGQPAQGFSRQERARIAPHRKGHVPQFF
jgi:hypothetical protein